MDRRAFLMRAAAIGTAVAMPFQRATEQVRSLIPAGTRLLTYEKGAQGGYIGWVENELGHTVGWLTETGVYKTSNSSSTKECCRPSGQA